jgi:hypothetical protein
MIFVIGRALTTTTTTIITASTTTTTASTMIIPTTKTTSENDSEDDEWDPTRCVYPHVVTGEAMLTTCCSFLLRSLSINDNADALV